MVIRVKPYNPVTFQHNNRDFKLLAVVMKEDETISFFGLKDTRLICHLCLQPFSYWRAVCQWLARDKRLQVFTWKIRRVLHVSLLAVLRIYIYIPPSLASCKVTLWPHLFIHQALVLSFTMREIPVDYTSKSKTLMPRSILTGLLEKRTIWEICPILRQVSTRVPILLEKMLVRCTRF